MTKEKKTNEFDKKAREVIESIERGERPELAECLRRIDEVRKGLMSNQDALVMIMAVSDAMKLVVEDAQENGKKVDAFAFFELIMSSLVKLEIDGVIKITI